MQVGDALAGQVSIVALLVVDIPVVQFRPGRLALGVSWDRKLGWVARVAMPKFLSLLRRRMA